MWCVCMCLCMCVFVYVCVCVCVRVCVIEDYNVIKDYNFTRKMVPIKKRTSSFPIILSAGVFLEYNFGGGGQINFSGNRGGY